VENIKDTDANQNRFPVKAEVIMMQEFITFGFEKYEDTI